MALGFTVLVLGACAGPSAEDRALARLFWVAPGDFAARADLPAGLGVEGAPRLTVALTEQGAATPLVHRFTLRPAGTDLWQLQRRDHRRFAMMQQRVVASIGMQATVHVGLDMAYCAYAGQAPGRSAPRAEAWDTSTGQVMMSRPAPSTAAVLYPTLPSCR